jgi:uncharacterized membrane protein YhaH (DUF805 family)
MSNINWGHLLFGFGGRINRAKWWLTVLVSIIISVVVGIVTAVIPSESLGAVITLAAFIPQLWISLAAGVKRLHDLNRTGAWLVLFYLGPALLIIAFFAIVGVDVLAALVSDKPLESGVLARVGTTAVIVGLLMFILSVWAFIWFGCLRGTVGPNQYGPDPLETRI